MFEFYDRLRVLCSENKPFVSVTIVDSIGSVPQDAGSKMLVTADGLYYGTVGGGKIEKRAIEEALSLIVSLASGTEISDDPGSSIGPDCDKDSSVSRVRTGARRTHFVDWRLDKDVGMTCGGSVKLYFELFNVGVWNIVIFGAGHCSNALISLLTKLDCRITCYDQREEWLNRLPSSANLECVRCLDLPSMVPDIPKDSYVLLLTMGHTTDSPILLSILKRWNESPFPYLGVIGSRAKAARLYQDIEAAGLPIECRELFHCPMGLPLGNNHPYEIAVSITAQLLETRDRLSRKSSV